MTETKVTPLGAGQDVGRSCILLTIGGKNIMLDCGMHIGYNDDRQFPDFTYIAQEGRLTDRLNCVIISHFHLDHCGALPYVTEMVGYDGPINVGESVLVKVSGDDDCKNIVVSWSHQDEDIGSHIQKVLWPDP